MSKRGGCLQRLRSRLQSLRLRLMLAGAVLAVVFMLLLLPLLRGIFFDALEHSIEKRLASDAATIISAARIERGELRMPDKMPDEQFDNLDSHQLGFIYNRDGKVLWRSRSSFDEPVHYVPTYDGGGHQLTRFDDNNGREYFVYDIEVALLGNDRTALSIVTMQPASEYQELFDGFTWRLSSWLAVALLVLLTLLWGGLTWGFRSLRTLREELDGIEAGTRDQLSSDQPRELLRLTQSLNRLLESERLQRERYRHSLDDLAHSLKTPLAVLQGVGENLAGQVQNREPVQLMQAQIERMSQQIGYQLQRASLRRSGLIRHREPVRPLLESLCQSLDKVYRDKRVQVTLALEGECLVDMERGALMELLGNLLENAFRLCVSQVQVSVRDESGLITLCVEDDGPGVPVNQRARVLRRGERADTHHEGQGIGLAVVQDIIDSYGGQLLLDDSPLGGARFSVQLGR